MTSALGQSGNAAEGATLKDQGNILFKKGDYPAALRKYSQGILTKAAQIDSNNALDCTANK
jgi:hypothetical protein